MTHSWIFLHGINNTPAVWQPVIQRTAAPERAVSPTLPALDNIDAIATQLWPTLSASNLLVGHSFGGYLSLALLAQRPECIRGIVLVNSHTRTDSSQAQLIREQTAQQAETGQYASLVEAVTQRVYHPSNLSNIELMKGRLQQAAQYGADRFAAHQRACAARSSHEETLRNFKGPKLVVAGDADQVITAQDQRAMAEAVQAEFVCIEGAGHMLPAEQPAKLAACIRRWAESFADNSLN